ncbi:hypothetical protein GALL_547380 [mine drainage metagenome]|uniref:Uncharacterized protein n=1 Tax=mine drainage metagenome TaxID=410659 RepID=A0A1J5NY96_9ZZZZ
MLLATLTWATSLTRTGVPRTVAMTVLRMSSALANAPCTRTIRVSSPSSSRPAPSLLLLAVSARRNWLSDRPQAESRVGSGWISKARTSPPSMFTSATPGTVRRAGRTSHCRALRFCSSVASPSTVNMNRSDNGVVIGASPPCTEAGRSPRTLDSASETCCRAQYTSVPSLKSTVMSAMPYFEVERTMRLLAMPSTSCSIGRTTRVSTSSGVIPGTFMMIFTCGEDTSGKASTGSARQAKIPPITSANMAPTVSRRWRSAPCVRDMRFMEPPRPRQP